MKSEEYNIRAARAEDIPQMVSLVREGFPQVVDRIIYGCDGVDRFIEDNLANPSYAYIVVECDTRVCGMIEYRILPESNFLNYIVLGSEIRGRGLAGRILEDSRRFLPPRAKMSLDVFCDNTRAIGLYEKLGFSPTGTLSTISDISFREEPARIEKPFEIINTTENREKFERYGFSMFEFKDDEKNYAVGLIGRKWLRITDETILCDGQALSFIRTMNPGRDFFCIITDENISLPHWVSLKNIITSQRMER